MASEKRRGLDRRCRIAVWTVVAPVERAMVRIIVGVEHQRDGECAETRNSKNEVHPHFV